MTTEPPPPGPDDRPPQDDPFRKQPPPGEGAGSPHGTPPGGGSPYDTPPGGGSAPGGGPQPPPYGGGPYDGGPYGGGYGGGPYGGGPADPLAGMPPLADSGKRTLARVIDMILVGAVVVLLSWLFGVGEYDMAGEDIDTARSFGQSTIAAVLYIAYDTLMTARTGQTLGKKWLNMRVAQLDNGATPSVQSALLRAAVLWLPFAFCCACVWTAITGGVSFLDKPYKQGLHDKAAKTVVVSTD
ncbi:RDD family protein [Streptomyces sp. NPDC052687]|uniref:RDD family protein n=1 Tax=Streptomyces sp. NPDC052687 TaxID=3154759 RepID=UPI0034147C90